MIENNLKRIYMFYIYYTWKTTWTEYIYIFDCMYITKSHCCTVELTQHYKPINYNFKNTHTEQIFFLFSKKTAQFVLLNEQETKQGFHKSKVKWFNIIVNGCCWAMKDARILGLQRRGIQLGVRLDPAELLCNKILLKYKTDRESLWHRHRWKRRAKKLA